MSRRHTELTDEPGHLSCCRAYAQITTPVKRIRSSVLVMARSRNSSFRPACPHGPCGSRVAGGEPPDVIEHGRTGSGARRYRCRWCGRTYSPSGRTRSVQLKVLRSNLAQDEEAFNQALSLASRAAATLDLRTSQPESVIRVLRGLADRQRLSDLAAAEGVDVRTAKAWLRKIANHPSGPECWKACVDDVFSGAYAEPDGSPRRKRLDRVLGEYRH